MLKFGLKKKSFIIWSSVVKGRLKVQLKNDCAIGLVWSWLVFLIQFILKSVPFCWHGIYRRSCSFSNWKKRYELDSFVDEGHQWNAGKIISKILHGWTKVSLRRCGQLKFLSHNKSTLELEGVAPIQQWELKGPELAGWLAGGAYVCCVEFDFRFLVILFLWTRMSVLYKTFGISCCWTDLRLWGLNLMLVIKYSRLWFNVSDITVVIQRTKFL